MLKELRISNFKCFGEHVTIPLAPITLIYGENSAGKSALLQAIRLLSNSLFRKEKKDKEKKAKEREEYFTHCAIGSVSAPPAIHTVNVPYKQLVHNNDCSKPITITVASQSADHGRVDLKAVYAPRKATDQRSAGYVSQLDINSAKAVVEQNTAHEVTGISEIVAKVSVMLCEDILKAHYDLLKSRRKTIAEHYSRFIELLIMQDYVEDNPDVRDKVRATAQQGCGLDISSTSTNCCFNGNRVKDKYTQDMEDWVLFGVPGWAQYRKTPEYQQRRAQYELKYADDVKYFESDFNFDQHKQRYRDDYINCIVPLDDKKNHRGDVIRTLPAFVRDFIISADPAIQLSFSLYIEPTYYDEFTGDYRAEYALLELDPFGYTFDLRDHSIQQVLFLKKARSELNLENLLFDIHDHYVAQFNATLKTFPLNKHLAILPPIREAPKDDYAPNSPLGWLANETHTRISVNKWLTNLETCYHVEYEDSKTGGGKSVYLVDTSNDDQHPVLISEAGFGFSQVLPIVIECLKDDNKIIMIEEPELHIHPKLQANLGDLFCDAIKNRQHQLLIETHSEHLMLRIQRLIRKGVLKSGDVSVLYVSRNANGSSVQRLRLDCDGEFMDEWPGGFFEESFNEIFGDS